MVELKLTKDKPTSGELKGEILYKSISIDLKSGQFVARLTDTFGVIKNKPIKRSGTYSLSEWAKCELIYEAEHDCELDYQLNL